MNGQGSTNTSRHPRSVITSRHPPSTITSICNMTCDEIKVPSGTVVVTHLFVKKNTN